MSDFDDSRSELVELWGHMESWLAAEEKRIKLREEAVTKRERQLERKVIPTELCPYCNKVLRA